jgi:phage head maturation protease
MATTENASREAGAAVPTPLPRENLYRINPDIALTRAEGAAMPTLTGHFAVWDQWTEIRSAYEGNFMERFSEKSMTKTLSENTPKVLFQHGKDPQIGDKVLGPVSRVEPDATGAFYEVPLLDTSYNRDLVPGLEAGLYGASFRFSVLQEDVNKKPARSDANPRGIPERTVTEARVMEFGPVTFPAYANATAGVRSITDEFLIANLLADDGMVERLAQAVADKSRVSVYFGSKPAASTARTTDLEPDPSEETTPAPGENEPASTDEVREEPEPSEATTPETDRGLFWFVADPTLKGAKKQ